MGLAIIITLAIIGFRFKRMAEGKAKLRAAQKDEVLERIKDRDKDASDIGAADDERLLDELSDRRDKPG